MPVTLRIDHAANTDDLDEGVLVVRGVRSDHIDEDAPDPVSYTHLTLPTICSV